MARYKKLDRGALLDAAEVVVREQGAHVLSIGSVAKAAGVSRGGIQSCFGTKDELVEALFGRWGEELNAILDEVRESAPNAEPLDLFLSASRRLHVGAPQRNAAMMILMSQTEERRAWGRRWISERMGAIDPSTELGRRQRLKFMLWESLLVVKSMQITEFSDSDWEEIFDDLQELLQTDSA